MRAKPIIIGSTLLLALAVVGVDHFFSTTAVAAPIGQTSVPKWESTPEDTSSWRREPIKSPTAPNKHIPGQPLKQGTSGVSADLVLKGIMKSNKHYYAIINGVTVKPGDHIEGWTIAEISRYRVTVRRQKEKQIYDIYQGRIDRGTR